MTTAAQLRDRLGTGFLTRRPRVCSPFTRFRTPANVRTEYARGRTTGDKTALTVAAMTRYRKPLLLVHVAGSVALLGATASSVLLAIVAATDASSAHTAYEVMGMQAFVFGIPLSFTALITGVLLGRATKWRTLTYRWTAGKLGMTLAVILNGSLVLGPTTAQRLEGDASAWFLVAAEGLTVALLLSATSLSVFKPGGRLRRVARP
ncbi:hypothetical protein OJ998_08110 [Solirubrobacter taibaiensis]|nr:hypothetical protein [Solirubrobacter taibaiensis]